MSLNRHAKKRDDNERAIIDTWVHMGAYVESLGGKGTPDNLVHHEAALWRAETKGAQGGLTPAQVASFTKAWLAGVKTYIVRNAPEALAMLEGRLTPWHPNDGALAGADRKPRPFRPGRSKARTLQESCRADHCAISRVPGWEKCAKHLADSVLP